MNTHKPFHTLIIIIITTWLLFVSCSQEDEYYENEMYTLAENLKTRYPEQEILIYKYPTITEIMNSSAVQETAEDAWEDMTENASQSGRTEYGFYIYYKHSTREIYCGEIVAGSTIPGCEDTNGEISLGSNSNNLEVCAFYHCHTTLFFCPPTCSRKTGPSSSDLSWAASQGIPGLVDDYSVETLWGGTPIKSPHHMRTIGPTQRAPFMVPI